VLDMISHRKNLVAWAAFCTGLVAGFRDLFSALSSAPDEENSMGIGTAQAPSDG
jgi:hypothetical protein